MGTELPAPQGEAQVAPRDMAERSTALHSAEQLSVPRGAEVFATERPAAQEVRTGQGVGDNATFAQVNGVSATTNDAATPTVATPTLSLDDVPVVAADEDLIEKQWVDSVKRVITQTRTDPYTQGEAIRRLQTDYLQKRYGKTLPNGEF